MSKIWNPDYTEIFVWRQNMIRKMSEDPNLVEGAKAYYKTHPIEWMSHWCDTYDPRNAGTSIPTRLPLVLFPRQEEFVTFLHQLLLEQENGLVEKARDMGATWVACGFSYWLWLYWDGSSIGWGSRKANLVDKIGDPDSIFEKIRMLINGTPSFFLPEGFSHKDHMGYMRIINPENQSTITGEAGTNIGRGGRKLIYFKDESSHYAHPEKIEAALADNTNVQIDISSVNGLGNIFQRRRESGHLYDGEIEKDRTNVFIFDWSDHPNKNQEWYDKRRDKAESEGLLHLFKQEVDRDYAASVEGVLIPTEWFDSAVDAHIKLEIDLTGQDMAALDVADEGRDKNAYSRRNGLILEYLEAWTGMDTGKTTRKAVSAKDKNVDIQYDCIGVGAGVKAESNRLREEELMHPTVKFHPWDAGSKVLLPDDHVISGDEESPINKDFYHNLKAQASWNLRLRFEKTHRSITEGIHYDPSELISIDSKLLSTTYRLELRKELAQITVGRSSTLKMLMNKTPDGTRSPNLADTVIMNYFPTATETYNLDNVG